MAEITLNGVPVPFPAESPNRGDGERWAGIVLHSTGGAFQGAVRWLLQRVSKASAHFVVSRAGEVRQLVSLRHVAWHAGKSDWRGQGCANRFTIGIEMEHLDGRQDWPPVQLRAVAALCRALMAKYPHIGISDIVGHADVARPRGRKVDPRDFPWSAFRKLV
ncbi:MAG: N-acetylmuramoyl-L-alanine amidase [Armatimonadota bacterium]